MPPRDIPATDSTADSLTPYPSPPHATTQQNIITPSAPSENPLPTTDYQASRSTSIDEPVASIPINQTNQPVADLDIQYDVQTSPQPETPISSTPTPNSSLTPASQSSSPDKPAHSKKKKILFIGAITSVLLLVLGGGFAVYAAFISNPQVVLNDVVKNTLTSDTFINSGKVRIKSEQENMQGLMNLTFTNKADTLKTIGSFGVNADVKYNDFKINISGDAMVTNSNNLYVKFNNAAKTYDTVFAAFGESYMDSPEFSQAAEKMKAIIKKIDGRWIKLEDSGNQIKQTRKAFQKAAQCTRNAVDKLYEDRKQYDEIQKAFFKHQFIELKPTGNSETIDNIDSVEYKPVYSAAKSNKFGKAIEKSSLTKNIDKCFNPSYDQTQEEGEKYNASTEEIRESQKQFDNANIRVWIGRWDHRIHKITSSSYDNNTKTSNDFVMNITQNKVVNIADPPGAILFKDIEKDIEAISQETGLGDVGLINGDQQAQAKTTSNQMNALLLMKNVTTYQSKNNGKTPTLTQLQASNNIDAEIKPLLSDQPPSLAQPDKIFYKYCTTDSFQISFWDYKSNSVKSIDDYTCNSSSATQFSLL